jgi:hypothetical membrane protein
MSAIANKKIGSSALTIIIIILILVLFLFPLLFVQDYSIIRNTLYDLGAQSFPYSGVMNIFLIALGLGSILSGWRFYEGFAFHRIILVMFGVSLSMTGIFNQAPVNTMSIYDVNEDGWHDYFKNTAILSFIILSIITAFILAKQKERMLAFASGISVIFLSVIITKSEMFQGLWQRIMFLIIVAWMIYNFKYGEIL